MIPLLVFLLACAAVYLGTIEAAFSALMRLSLRLVAERSGRPGSEFKSISPRCAIAVSVVVLGIVLLFRRVGV